LAARGRPHAASAASNDERRARLEQAIKSEDLATVIADRPENAGDAAIEKVRESPFRQTLVCLTAQLMVLGLPSCRFLCWPHQRD
jgi:hypothetical protein